jgi:ligand-binding SRPBCC domain-containing protein
MRTFELLDSMWLDRPVGTVFAFFANAENLTVLTPEWLHFRILTPTPIEMRAGQQIEYRIRLRGIPMRWTSLISRWNPPHVFVDEQLRGPYRRWIHEHRFEAADGGTRVTDRVRYSVWGGALAHRLVVKRDLEEIFRYRTERLVGRFGGSNAVGEERSHV